MYCMYVIVENWNNLQSGLADSCLVLTQRPIFQRRSSYSFLLLSILLLSRMKYLWNPQFSVYKDCYDYRTSFCPAKTGGSVHSLTLLYLEIATPHWKIWNILCPFYFYPVSSLKNWSLFQVLARIGGRATKTVNKPTSKCPPTVIIWYHWCFSHVQNSQAKRFNASVVLSSDIKPPWIIHMYIQTVLPRKCSLA